MLKKVIISMAIIISILANVFTMQVFSAPSADDYNAIAVDNIQSKANVFDLKAKSYILMDGNTGSVLLENNSNEKLPLASVTKVMTMLLIMEAIDSGKLSMEDMVPVSEHSYSMGGSQVYLKPGEEFTVKDMLKAVAIHSANDASVALAEKIAGSEDIFVSMMNEKAKALGMNNTNFLDCTGLTDDGHYSSSYDVALMSRELIMKHPKILEFTSIWMDTFRDGKFELANTNKLVKHYTGTNGLKTGFTSKAGYCLSASALRNNMQLISVVLGEPDTNTRFAETRKLLDYGFSNFELLQVDSKGGEIGEIEIKKGLKTKIKAIFDNDVKLLVHKGDKDRITKEIRLTEDVTAPVTQGQKIGEVIYKIGDKELGKADAVSSENVEKASFLRLFFRMVISWFGLGR